MPSNPFSGYQLPTTTTTRIGDVLGAGNPNFSTVRPTFNYPTTPTFPTSTATVTTNSGGSSNATGYFNTVASLVSQWLTGYAKNPTTQISPSGQITGIANPNLIAAYGAQTQQTQALAQYQGNTGGGVGNQAINTAGNFLDGIAQSFGISTTTFVIVAGVGIYLLFKQPPSRR